MESFKERLAHILRSKNLTGAQFAGLMGIQPSNVSHLISGRNNPSLDFLIKLKETFPEYSFDWIILGKKPITIVEPYNAAGQPEVRNQVEKDQNVQLNFDIVEEDSAAADPVQKPFVNEKTDESTFYSDNHDDMIEKPHFNSHNDSPKRVLIMYEDNTFEMFNLRR
ncbi:MAG: helix-turn-helix domain-containing protein [Bacteroidales bacterium]|nr:helix-turn-helix domain-containing protein [Bacteroidales bacterium]